MPEYINVKGRLMDLSEPKVMGILNVTPDSFYGGCRAVTEDEIEKRVRQILDEGADIIDIGAYSSSPYAEIVSLLSWPSWQISSPRSMSLRRVLFSFE